MSNAEQKKISCAVIGLGAFGKHYIRLLSHNERTILSAVVSPSAYSRDLDIPSHTKRYADINEVLRDTTIDAFVIATPLSTHAKIATLALRAGKHVLLEKPLASNSKEAHEIEAAVVDAKKVFLLAHQYLYNDDIAVLKKELDGGRIGKVRFIHCEQLYTGPMRFDVGCFREGATHEIAIIDYLFSPGSPVSVKTSAIDITGGSREDFATASIRYESGLLVHIIVSSYSPIKSRRMLLSAENGMAIFDDQAPENKVSFQLRPFPAKEKLVQTKSLPIPEGEYYVPKINRGEPLAQEVEHFLDCIENNSTPRSDIAHALRVEAVLDMVAQSMRTSA